MRTALHSLGLAILVSAGSISGVTAGERYGYDGYTGGYGDRSGYGFAAEAIGGSYIGAPLTRFPRPNELVPSAWGYGTYGVPTVTGIRQAPTAAPTLTVIDGYKPAPRRRAARGPYRGITGQWAREAETAGSGQSGVRVISVTVPRR
ncbi:hypothetical protein [Methylobacterium haplocladii]|uniref:Uncharacterized protein n=1 Tax=Methylobacterium haplocladii TaxID=1176176 RepID=A0A512IR56_9HYPH|nr:hypothetical protein [Methylobacterium haplocladii]GEP00188.1 hypothetical protein MHA02_25750 [Methylobacterium haplocladii]GJD83757.1 hypothetical protein HPGCJGGD_1628 [Methylobacterium haplocladii]GLS57966.1 hypothetical protein GCM10007887_06220 [Methylobacterium haplocladii]